MMLSAAGRIAGCPPAVLAHVSEYGLFGMLSTAASAARMQAQVACLASPVPLAANVPDPTDLHYD